MDKEVNKSKCCLYTVSSGSLLIKHNITGTLWFSLCHLYHWPCWLTCLLTPGGILKGRGIYGVQFLGGNLRPGRFLLWMILPSVPPLSLHHSESSEASGEVNSLFIVHCLVVYIGAIPLWEISGMAGSCRWCCHLSLTGWFISSHETYKDRQQTRQRRHVDKTNKHVNLFHLRRLTKTDKLDKGGVGIKLLLINLIQFRRLSKGLQTKETWIKCQSNITLISIETKLIQ